MSKLNKNSTTTPNKIRMAIPQGNPKEIISRLMEKISDQSNEIDNLKKELNNANTIISEYENDLFKYPNSNRIPVSSASSAVALSNEITMRKNSEKQLRGQIDSLGKLLEISETRFQEANKSKKLLTAELQLKAKEIRVLEKKLKDSLADNHMLQSKLGHSVRITASTISNANNSKTSHSPTINLSETTSKSETLHRSVSDIELLDNEKLRKLLEQTQTKLKDSHIKVKALEQALKFRAEEIGLSGHAELMQKMTKLRNEVTELKNELEDKNQRLSEAEETKISLESDHESLQRQIAIMQQKVMISQQEIDQKSHKDLSEELAAAEHDRDVLLEFIQGDMQKSQVLSQQIVTMENELKQMYDDLDSANKKLQHTQAALDEEMKKNHDLKASSMSLEMQIQDAKRSKSSIDTDKTILLQDIERKAIEIDELSKMQMNLLMQIREKDDNFHQISEELKLSVVKIRDYETIIPNLKAENETFKDSLISKDTEIKDLKTQLETVNPLISQYEPELLLLRSEKLEWSKVNSKLKLEIERLTSLDKAVIELEQELGRITSSVSLQQHGSSSLSTPSGKSSSPSSSSPVSLSQKHTVWTSLPTIRRISSSLYEKIRSMGYDLHRTEVELNECQAHSNSLKNELESMKKELENELLRVGKSHELSNKLIEDYKNKISQTEAELTDFRSMKTIIQQIKHTIHSSNMNMNITQTYETSLDVDKIIPDYIIPDIISRMVLDLSQALRDLKDISSKHNNLVLEHDSFKVSVNEINISNHSAQESITLLKNELMRKDNAYEKTEHQMRSELRIATELVEKQNSLVISLESKCEQMKNEKLIFAAQLNSLQQREDFVKQKIYQVLEEYARSIGIENISSIISVHTKTIDLLQYLSDILKQFAHQLSVQASKQILTNVLSRQPEQNMNHTLSSFVNQQPSLNQYGQYGSENVYRQPPQQQFGNILNDSLVRDVTSKSNPFPLMNNKLVFSPKANLSQSSPAVLNFPRNNQPQYAQPPAYIDSIKAIPNYGATVSSTPNGISSNVNPSDIQSRIIQAQQIFDRIRGNV